MPAYQTQTESDLRKMVIDQDVLQGGRLRQLMTAFDVMWTLQPEKASYLLVVSVHGVNDKKYEAKMHIPLVDITVPSRLQEMLNIEVGQIVHTLVWLLETDIYPRSSDVTTNVVIPQSSETDVMMPADNTAALRAPLPEVPHRKPRPGNRPQRRR